MTALPPSSDFTGSSITEGQFKTGITSLRTFIADLLGSDSTNKVAALTALGAVLNSGISKSGAYTVVAGDKGNVFSCTGTFTLSVTAAATLGDGFSFAVLNSGTGTITIDPSGSELIDGSVTASLPPGWMVIVYCNGSKFSTVGREVSTEINVAFGVGSVVSLPNVPPGASIASLATIAGSSLSLPCGATSGGVYTYQTLPGTWRNITSTTINNAYPSLSLAMGLFQRIA